MFTPNTTVAWVTKSIAYLGQFIEGNERVSIVLVTGQSKGRKLEGKRIAVATCALGEVIAGKAVVTKI